MPITLVFNLSKFRAAFEQSGLSKRRFAAECGYTSTQPLYDYLKGYKTPQLASIERLAKGLGCTVEDLTDTVITIPVGGDRV